MERALDLWRASGWPVATAERASTEPLSLSARTFRRQTGSGRHRVLPGAREDGPDAAAIEDAPARAPAFPPIRRGRGFGRRERYGRGLNAAAPPMFRCRIRAPRTLPEIHAVRTEPTSAAASAVSGKTPAPLRRARTGGTILHRTLLASRMKGRGLSTRMPWRGRSGLRSSAI